MTPRIILPLVVLLVFIAACDQPERSSAIKPPITDADLETRTFNLRIMKPEEAAALVRPYVYKDRPGAPGDLSYFIDTPLISVRETADNLDKIARMLQEFDADAIEQQYRLHFQIVVANGGQSHDARLASVEEELRKVFRFDGFTLLGEAYITVSGGDFKLEVNPYRNRQVSGSNLEQVTQTYRIDGTLSRENKMDIGISVGQAHIQTGFGFEFGQTIVIGSLSLDGRTIFVVLHIDESTFEESVRSIMNDHRSSVR